MQKMPQLRKPSALKDWAYETIKQNILDMHFPPGTNICIEELSEQLDVSRTPIREALLRLESDGLVRSVPRVGFFVIQITKRDLEELFELRILLESYAARKAASNLTDEDVTQLEHLNREAALGVEQEDRQRFLEAEVAFHTLIIDRTQNGRLIEVMRGLEELTHRERLLSLESADNVRQTLTEHQHIAEAMQQRDAELAAQRMQEHLQAAKQRLLSLYDTFHSYEYEQEEERGG